MERPAIVVQRWYTTPEVQNVFNLFEWEKRHVEIKDEEGKVVYAGEGEFPKQMSATASQIIASKYFRMVEQTDGSLRRETSFKEVIVRVVETITAWGLHQGYFVGFNDATAFKDELMYLLVNQAAAFNSPVWFNLGTKRGRPGEEQCSACFINSIDDTMESILELSTTEGMLYKHGSGSGVNYSPLRSSKERLSGGGTASGPVPFIQKDDTNAGAIKSGGTTRRAAKMVILDVDHGDILEFIQTKVLAERAAHALIDAGFNGHFDARYGAYQLVPFQNANHSVRVTDAFMRAVVEDGPWHLLARDGQILDTIPAKSVWRAICEAAHECGDPGLQFDTTINEMHTTPNHGRINASNPCSEYMHVDDSACNLASLNLRKFQTVDGKFNADELLHAVDVMILAQDILVDNARYPTGKIGANAKKFRQLGLGYANLGALLMSMGLPYDSEEGRTMAGAITALMCGRAYRRSAEIAKRMGKFEGSKGDEHNMMHVIEKHRASCKKLELQPYDFLDLIHNAYKQWSEAAHLGATHGYRNAQATVLAPTGTIGFMMDCDTTGIEPDTALVKTKKLVGGGKLRMVNQTVVAGLQNLGYHPQIVKEIMDHVSELGTIEGSQHILSEHLPVFDCAFATANGRSLRPEAHVLMMGAVQPFISGAISKTCNMPYNATVQDVENIYMLAWVRGIKAIAIYRDGCKRSQPLSTLNTAVTVTSTAAPKNVADVTKEIYNWLDIVKPNGAPLAIRRRLPDERNSYTHKFSIAGHEGYITVGMYNDGSPGEIFVRMAKEGSAVSGLMDCFATVTSIALQHGVPLEALVEKFAHTKFEPSGFSTNPNIGMTTSIMDYLFRWLRQKFLMTNPLVNASISDTNVSVSPAASQDTIETVFTARMTVIDHNLCPNCGSITVRTGTCHACPECAWSGGCG